ncbi:MAG TPA: anti-sigma factor [Acidimicrobiales bacterium]|nr:anti-sigma factor [Acidimicrobiales bacterium]
MTMLQHTEAEDLLGAYALDALEPDETIAVDDHLRDCPRCRAEVASFRETAALLAYGGAEAPPGVWEKIQASLEEAPPRLELARVIPIKRSRWETQGARLTAMAAVVIAIAALGVTTIRSRSTSCVTPVECAAGAPDGRSVHLAAASGTGSADFVILDGRAYLVRHSLPKLPDDETYQLWGQQGETRVSLGVLGSNPNQTIVAAGADYQAMAITAEKKPGVVSSSNPAIVAGLVPVD